MLMERQTLIKAILEGDLGTVRQCILGNSKLLMLPLNKEGITPFNLAVKCNQKQILNELLSFRAHAVRFEASAVIN